MECLAIVVAIAIILLVSAQEKLPHIDRIKHGYDVFQGNPRSDVSDRGWRNSVLRVAYSRNERSSDGRWLYPDSVEVLYI